ncbi:MAG: TonB-dependent receptor plug domain-containing protein [Chitinophagaceae bacterium]
MGVCLLFTNSSLYAQETIGGKLNVISVSENSEDTSISPKHKKLDEVGYGTQKSKDLTSPIVTVSTEDVVQHTTSNVLSSLVESVWGGVQIQNSGQPGVPPGVTIRGIGSFNNSSPLYVVDGMFYDNIGF